MGIDKMERDMYGLIKRLYPICRSITGNGNRQTLKIVKEHIPIKIHEISTGTRVFDWIIPKEWNIKGAYIKDPKGKKIVDFKKSNLHVLNYSTPVNRKISFDELKEHLFTTKDHPDDIPYLTSYYKKNWGFCLSYKEYKKLKKGTYEAVIDSTLKDGHLSYGELYLKGKIEDEFLLSTYICHPSLCNDNLSGVSLLTFLAKELKNRKLKYSYRFLFIPETIGAITWLSLNQDEVSRIKFGLVATCVGDRGILTYQRTRTGNSAIDRIAQRVLADSGSPYKIRDFFPSGSDERQFSSPGFGLSMGSLMRTPYHLFPEYHTSADNLKFVSQEHLADSFQRYADVINAVENSRVYISLNPKCEPRLGPRGLCRTIGGQKVDMNELAIRWVLNLSDGANSLDDISIRSGMPLSQIKGAAGILVEKGLLKEKT